MCAWVCARARVQQYYGFPARCWRSLRSVTEPGFEPNPDSSIDDMDLMVVQLPSPRATPQLVLGSLIAMCAVPCCCYIGFAMILSSFSKKFRAMNVMSQYRCDAPATVRDGGAGLGDKFV